MSEVILSGLSCGAYLLITSPLRPTRNLVKFHLIPSLPKMPGACALILNFYKKNFQVSLLPLSNYLLCQMSFNLKLISNFANLAFYELGLCIELLS